MIIHICRINIVEYDKVIKIKAGRYTSPHNHAIIVTVHSLCFIHEGNDTKEIK